MIPLAICVGLIALIFWAANKYERKIKVLHKWYSRHEPKIKLNPAQVAEVIKACELIMEITDDAQSDEYRMAANLKLQLEKRLRENCVF